jgi:hypothetical protein
MSGRRQVLEPGWLTVTPNNGPVERRATLPIKSSLSQIRGIWPPCAINSWVEQGQANIELSKMNLERDKFDKKEGNILVDVQKNQ